MENFEANAKSEFAKAKEQAGSEKVAVIADWVDRGVIYKSEFVGYASSWSEAKKVIREHGYRIILKRGDVVMREINGFEARELGLSDKNAIVICANVSKTNRYKITYREKSYVSHGTDCDDAMERFAGKKVFGLPFILDFSLLQCDADTRGEKWAQYKVPGPDGAQFYAMVELAKDI